MSESSFLLYIETNFLMGIATGRDPKADVLLAHPPEGLRLAIPQVCFMEALSVSGRVEKQRARLTNRLEREIAQVRRDLTSRNAKDLLPLLERANVTNQKLGKDVSTRLFDAIHLLGWVKPPSSSLYQERSWTRAVNQFSSRITRTT
jgi:predicted nucleic acid-binding protein